MSLNAISTIDGRYHEEIKELSPFFSESALMKYRLMVEIEYLIALRKVIKKTVPKGDRVLREIYENFSLKDAVEIKRIEKTTRHDVKAVEYFLNKRVKSSLIHFALTSEDVNNIAYALMWQDSLKEIYFPQIGQLHNKLSALARTWRKQPMLAMTHGQPATPTTLGKEFSVYAGRLKREIGLLKKHKLEAKLNGATGTWGAHYVAYPNINWITFSKKFIASFGLLPKNLTTQVESYDSLVESYQIVQRINTILTDLARDMWLYISRGVFVQKKKAGEIGSSTMPHKINPIDFENAEGNLKLANVYFSHMAGTLPLSRLQRDLSNSTLIRSQGVPFAHSILAYKKIVDGLLKLNVNTDLLSQELDAHWEVLGEALQTVLRKYGDLKGYEIIKKLLHGQKIDKNRIHFIISRLYLPEDEKNRLLKLTPETYLGVADRFTVV